jgi:hypothetical protein
MESEATTNSKPQASSTYEVVYHRVRPLVEIIFPLITTLRDLELCNILFGHVMLAVTCHSKQKENM